MEQGPNGDCRLVMPGALSKSVNVSLDMDGFQDISRLGEARPRGLPRVSHRAGLLAVTGLGARSGGPVRPGGPCDWQGASAPSV